MFCQSLTPVDNEVDNEARRTHSLKVSGYITFLSSLQNIEHQDLLNDYFAAVFLI
jgi:hypothetical protein